MDKTYRIIIVEDDNEIRARLACLLQTHDCFDVVAICSNFSEGIRAVSEDQPDILLTDLGLPDGSGINIIKTMVEKAPDCEAMVISGFQDEHIVFEALQSGASSYILKHDESTNIIDAIESMIKGGAPMSPVIARLMLQKFQAPPVQVHPAKSQAPATQKKTEELTEHQLRILKYISQGFSSKEIAQKLDVSYYTVTTHIKNIYKKLQVNSRTEALHEAVKMGLVSS